MNENLNAKVKLLYEGNANSPLFLKTADLYLAQNKTQIALQILEEGLKIYPEHPLAFILLGKANYSLGNVDLANSLIKRASELLNSSRTYSYYKKEFSFPEKTDSPFDFSRGSFFTKSYEDEDAFKSNQNLTKSNNSIDERLSQLADEVMNARIERDDSFSIPETNKEIYQPNRSKLASETLANIYFTQGEKNEAIKIFELLIDRNPEKKDYYLKKISEIKSA